VVSRGDAGKELHSASLLAVADETPRRFSKPPLSQRRLSWTQRVLDQSNLDSHTPVSSTTVPR